MFTGLVEELGVIERLDRRGDFYSVTVSCKKILDDVKLGDSIAVNGTCLTVVSFTNSSFTVEAVKETIDRTSLSALRIGSFVNLERALKASDRLGGHFVSGHVDCVGTVTEKRVEGNAVIFSVEIPDDHSRYVIEKGSITIDGISLTVAKIDGQIFTCSIIPHTFDHTTLKDKWVGSKVNLECDVIGKYVEKFASPYINKPAKKSKVSEEWLRQMGY